MQVVVLALLSVAWGRAAGGAVGWPGALPLAAPLQAVRTYVPATSKGFAYSTSQYINALPGVSYSFGLRPQVSFAPSQSLAPFTALQSSYYPFAGSSFYPHSSTIYYPALSPVILPQAPVSAPGFPGSNTETPAGDTDTDVVDSADSPVEPSAPLKPSAEAPSADNPQADMPSQPEQIPQAPSNDPSSPSFPHKELTAHGDFVKDVAFQVQDLEALVRRAKGAGANIIKDITEEQDDHGSVRYAVLKTYGDNTHTLIDRSKYDGVFLPHYQPLQNDVINSMLPTTNLEFIDHVEGNMEDGTLDDSVSWYEKNLNMHRFWCVDYKHDLAPYSCIRSASVINQDETVLLSLNEAAKGLRPTSKASEFVRALGASGVEHVALSTDDIVATMKNLKARGADVLSWPPTYYQLIKEKLKNSSVKVAESIEELQENNILIDFDERGYMLQAFTKHVQARPTLFIEILQRRNHRGFGAMNYKWVFEAIERLETAEEGGEDAEENKTKPE